MNPSGKLCVITGASSGMGRAVAYRRAAKGAKVVALARSAGTLTTLVNEIKSAGENIAAYPVDIADVVAVDAVAQDIAREHGVPDIVFNNAGGGTWRFLDESAVEDIVAMTAAPFLGAAILARAFLPGMRARGNGLIITMSSYAAITPFAGATMYIATRYAMRGLHEALCADLAGTGVRAMLVAPPKVSGPFWEHNPGSEGRLPTLAKMFPTLTPEQMAGYIVEGIEKDRTLVTGPLITKVAYALNQVFPFVTNALMRATGITYKTAGRS
ncbi:MAG: SDR family oxidoreductase [Nitrospinae bacterium]|nr:SDR family oxidoreductase [Nitrospinota bacterium]